MEFEFFAINEVKRPFKYVASVLPINNFSFALTKSQLVENIKELVSTFGFDGEGLDDYYHDINGFHSIDELENYVSDYVEKVSDERPHTIRYTGIPKPDVFELVVIAQISNSGHTFLFSNDKEFLQSLDI